jgi:prepilin-type N-terminal cleavage/methylation domain-containing protein
MKSWQAFTLVEMLMVIAIISILAAILLPVFSRTRSHYSQVTDVDNLKQITTAVIVYSQDNSDILPWANWAAGDVDTNGLSRPGWLYTYNQKTNPVPARYNEQTGLLWNMLNHPQMYLCPMDDPTIVRWSNKQNANAPRRQQASSYAINGAICGFKAALYPSVKMTQLRADDCAFWETDETEPAYFNDGANYPTEGVSARHIQGAIQAEFDGAVSYIKLTQWYSDVAYPGRNRLWCYPGSLDGR